MKSAPPTLLIAVVLVMPRSAITTADEAVESSDAYLRNVVEELQILNGVVPAAERNTRVSYPAAAAATAYDDPVPSESIHHHHQATSSDESSSFQNHHHLPSMGIANHELPPPPPQRQPLPRNPPSMSTYFAESAQPLQGPPTILGFTAAELAAMYRKALERGVPMKHDNNPEYSFDRTKVVPALRVQHPGYGAGVGGSNNYAYYFYPLNSFRHELEKQTAFGPAVGLPEVGYHTLPDSAYASTTVIDPNHGHQKETGGTSIMSHIISGVSSFIGMAIFFVLSMFVYPRFLHLMHFPFVSTARTDVRDELGHLVAFVAEAIDAYNQNTRRKSKHLPQR